MHLYHLGNNQLHREIYQRAVKQPGVVVLHDAVLQHFYLGSLDQSAYVEEFVFNYGEWERPMAQRLWNERAQSALDARYFERPMLRRVGESSLAVVVHNPAAADAVRRHVPPARIAEIPHFFDDTYAPRAEERTRMRATWNAGEELFIFGIFGYLRESKRIMATLRAFERLHASLPSTRLLLAGAFASQDLERAVHPWLSHPGVLRMPYLDEQDFWRAADAVDACISLRYPGAGETSGITIRLMGLGKPVLLTDSREVERFPPHICLRIPSGVEEMDQLFQHMKVVAVAPWLGREIGRHAAHYIRQEHRLEIVAARYWDTLCAVYDSSRLSRSR